MSKAEAIAALRKKFREVTKALSEAELNAWYRQFPLVPGDRSGGGGRSLRALEAEVSRLGRLQSEIMGALEELGALP